MLQLVTYLQLSQISHLYAVHLVITYSDQCIVTVYCIKMEVCASYNARSNNSKLQYCFKNGPLTANGNSAKKRAGNERAASQANGNGKPEFENGATLLSTVQLLG